MYYTKTYIFKKRKILKDSILVSKVFNFNIYNHVFLFTIVNNVSEQFFAHHCRIKFMLYVVIYIVGYKNK